MNGSLNKIKKEEEGGKRERRKEGRSLSIPVNPWSLSQYNREYDLFFISFDF